MSLNFANEAAIHARAASLAARLPETIRARCARLIAGALRNDPRNARALTQREWSQAPSWAKEARSRGIQPPVKFRPDPNSVARQRRFVVRVAAAHADLCTIAANASGPDGVQRMECARLFANLDHMSLDDIDAKARALAQRRRIITSAKTAAEARLIKHFPEEFCAAGVGQRWRRIVSTGDLGMVGKRMRNCVAYDRASHAHYALALRTDEAQFWVLENHRGEPTILAMFATASRTQLEARAPCNGELPRDCQELAHLIAAKKYLPHPMRMRPRREPVLDDQILLRRFRAMLAPLLPSLLPRRAGD